MQGIVALAIFFVVVFGWRSIYVKHGGLGFWQLVVDQPDVAYEWMEARPDWVVLKPNDPTVDQLKQSPDLVGPFSLFVPRLGGMVAMFAKSESIDTAQNEFIELYGGSREDPSFPWISWLAMLYPLIAMIWAASLGAPLLATLGYGFGNLGYLLLVAGLLAGSFRSLGLKYRTTTLIAAVAVWVAGTVLSNL